MDAYYRQDNSNVHRGVHALSARATAAFEGARERVGRFINAASSKEIVWTRNASEAINLVANTWGSANVGLGDEIVLSVAEHHGNLVPWQLLAQRSGAKLRFVKLTEAEELDLEHLESLLTPRAKLVALPHMSNTLGFVTDVGRVVDLAGRVGAKVLLDACQSVPNRPVDVKALGVDFLVASGHKMCGPTGIGFLWSRLSTLEKMPPWMGGGEMIEDVFLERSTFAPPPLRFEAGTPAIAEAIGLEAACDFLSGLGMDRVQAHEDELAGLMHDKLSAISGLRIYGPPPSAGRAALAAFNVQGMHATDISSVMDSMGVALRSGHMCTQPLHRALGVSASVRASAYVYNTPQEVDAMVEALKEALAFLRA